MFSLDLFSKHDFVNCGAGLDIQIKLISGSKNCTVKVKPELQHGKVLTWKDNDLGDCAYFDVDSSSKILIQTLSNIANFCPAIIELRMSDSNYTSYRSEMEDKIYSYNTNNLGHGLVKIWPTTSGMNCVVKNSFEIFFISGTILTPTKSQNPTTLIQEVLATTQQVVQRLGTRFFHRQVVYMATIKHE